MAESQRSGAYVWLAGASALLVLLASGVAISRLGERHDDGWVGSAPESPSTGADTGSAPGGGAVSGPASSAAPSAEGSSGAAGAAAGASVPGATATGNSGPDAGRPAAGRSVGTPRAASARTPTSAPSGSGSQGMDARYGAAGSGSRDSGAQAGGSQAGGSQGGGQASPPAPSRQPPEEMSLVGASVSAGQGDAGGVVGVGVDSTSPQADVTVGTNPVVGHHPPSQGTGIGLHGRFFHPPPSIPVPPG